MASTPTDSSRLTGRAATAGSLDTTAGAGAGAATGASTSGWIGAAGRCGSVVAVISESTSAVTMITASPVGLVSVTVPPSSPAAVVSTDTSTPSAVGSACSQR